MFKMDDFQNLNKNGYEAYVASATAMTKGFQAMAQEASDFSRKSFEKSSETLEQLKSVNTLDKAMEVQQNFARESYEALVAEASRLNDIYVAAAKEAYKPFESGLAAFGIKLPQQS